MAQINFLDTNRLVGVRGNPLKEEESNKSISLNGDSGETCKNGTYLQENVNYPLPNEITSTGMQTGFMDPRMGQHGPSSFGPGRGVPHNAHMYCASDVTPTYMPYSNNMMDRPNLLATGMSSVMHNGFIADPTRTNEIHNQIHRQNYDVTSYDYYSSSKEQMMKDNELDTSRGSLDRSSLDVSLEQHSDDPDKSSVHATQNRSGKKRQQRTTFAKWQLNVLRTYFNNDTRPAVETIDMLSNSLKLPVVVIRTWFQNKRSALKKQLKKDEAPQLPQNEAWSIEKSDPSMYQARMPPYTHQVPDASPVVARAGQIVVESAAKRPELCGNTLPATLAHPAINIPFDCYITPRP